MKYSKKLTIKLGVEKADKIMQLEIGKFYLVAHAVLCFEDGAVYEVPIIPLAHNDKQFGFDVVHHHIDGRFRMNRDVTNYFMVDGNGRTNHVVSTEKPTISETYKFSLIIYKKKKCIRITTGVKPPSSAMKIGTKFYNWSQTMIGKSCKGRKCPHLGTTMIHRDGRLICPLHNLIGDIEKELITGVEKF